MDKFKVGQRIIATNNHTGNYRIINQKGTILYTSFDYCGIVFDNNIGGHNCDKICKEGHGYYVDIRDLKISNINKRIC